jgi:cytochrome c-type protein NapC
MHEYVYDSACLKCHAGIKNPEKSMGLSPQIKLIHQKYYWDAKAAGKKVSCVSCHNDYTDTNFAHPNLLEMLPNSQK